MTSNAGLKIKFSSVEDGSIAAGGGKSSLAEHDERSVAFLVKHGFDPRDQARVFVTYLPENTYTHIERADQDTIGSIKCDALFTTVVGKTITLPVADCAATVVHDPITRMIGVLHLGRHSSVAGLIEEFAIRVADELGSDPRDWHVWMSPSLQMANNALEYFDPPHPDKWQGFMKAGVDGKIRIDAPGHNRNCFERLGVAQGNISVSSIDTFTSDRYFSHRAAVEGGEPERQGRMMVAAALVS
jgi:copper oxidase (laccase) domain-containing protein